MDEIQSGQFVMTIDEIELRQNLNFTDDDLVANRAGKMSERQRKALWRKLLNRNRMLLFAFFISSMALTYFLIVGDEEWEHPGQFWITAVIFAYITVLLVSKVGAIRTDIEHKKIAMVEGRIKLQIRKSREEVPMHRIHIDNTSLEFGVSSWEFKSFCNTALYRIYYAPRSKIILSAERLDL